MRRPLVDVHIEKTAGRSKRQVLLGAYGAERILHYDPTTDMLVRASQRLIVTESGFSEKIQELAANPILFPFIKIGYVATKALETRRGISPESIDVGFDVITGHLTGCRFAGIIPPESAYYTSVLREPLERMRSHYEHWKRTRGLARFRVRPEFSSATSFEEFALLPEMHNYQHSALGISPSRFAVIGVSSMLAEYLEEIGLSAAGQEIPHINRTKYETRPSYDSGFVRDFQEANQADYELYADVAKRWQDSATLSN